VAGPGRDEGDEPLALRAFVSLAGGRNLLGDGKARERIADTCAWSERTGNLALGRVG
jgi:hypothetical protein